MIMVVCLQTLLYKVLYSKNNYSLDLQYGISSLVASSGFLTYPFYIEYSERICIEPLEV